MRWRGPIAPAAPSRPACSTRPTPEHDHEDRPRSLHAPPRAAARAAALRGRARLRVHRALAARRFPRTGGCARASIRSGSRSSSERSRMPASSSPRCCRCTAGRARSRAERQTAVGQLEGRDPGRGRDGLRHHELGVRPRALARRAESLLLLCRRLHRGLRGGLVPLDGGAGADPREGGHPAQHRAASRGLRRDAAAGGRHDPGDQLEERALPLLRAAHLLLRRRHPGDDPRGGAGAGPRPHRRHLQPQGLLGPALHHQPARLARPPSISISTSARARSTGTSSSARWPRSASTAS